MIYRLFKIVTFVCIVASCNSNTYVMAPRPSAQTSQALMQMPDSLISKFNNGIDYYSSGNDPEPWNLSMDLEGQFFFVSAGNNLTLLARPGVMSSTGTTYTLKDAAGNITAELLNTFCTGTKSLQTVVTVNNKIYKGCGQYLYDRNLEGKWQLSKIKNKIIERTDYPKSLPKIIFNTLNNSLSINTSCNQLSLTYQITGNKLTIPGYPSTNKNCKSTFEDILNTSFYGKTCSYYVRGKSLILYLIDDSILEFVMIG